MTTRAARTLTLSAPAWSVAVRRSFSLPAGDSPEVPPHNPHTGYDAELLAAGLLTPDGRIHPDWAGAVRSAGNAPIKARLISTGEGIRTSCEVALFDGLGLSVDTSHPILPSDAASTGDQAPVVVNLFEGSDAWEVAAQTLPAFPELTSTAAGGARETARRIVSDDELKALEETARATVQFSVTAPGYQTLHLWLLSEHLEVTRLHRGESGEPPTAVLVRHPPGAVARQFVWDLLGAYQAVDAASHNAREVA